MTITFGQTKPAQWVKSLKARRRLRAPIANRNGRTLGTHLGRLVFSASMIGVVYFLGTLAAFWSL